jgi:hypothetical protein
MDDGALEVSFESGKGESTWLFKGRLLGEVLITG